MPEHPDSIEQLRRRLLELGCPTGRLQSLVHEVADHREDLKQAAMAEGLSESDAGTRACAQLGNPVDLAEHLMLTLRRSSWLGRHAFLAFCVLPLLLFPVIWSLILGALLTLVFGLSYGLNDKAIHAALGSPVVSHHFTVAVYYADLAAVASATLIFCWMARRASVRLTWKLVTCGICSFYGLFTFLYFKSYSLTAGACDNPQWIRGLIPLLVTGVFYVLQQRSRRLSSNITC
jgi:hypothetical protein